MEKGFKNSVTGYIAGYEGYDLQFDYQLDRRSCPQIVNFGGDIPCLYLSLFLSFQYSLYYQNVALKISPIKLFYFGKIAYELKISHRECGRLVARVNGLLSISNIALSPKIVPNCLIYIRGCCLLPIYLSKFYYKMHYLAILVRNDNVMVFRVVLIGHYEPAILRICFCTVNSK